MNRERRPGRVLRLPAEGKLLVCTDLHGNLRDFRRMIDLFARAEVAGERPFLLFTGDLIHGPFAKPEEWPPFLGTYFEDGSGELFDEYLALAQRYPEQIACLLGNHEHSHIGGPHTPKFWPDETVHFEEKVGPVRAARYRTAMARFPLVAIARCGVVFTHGAPNVEISHIDDLEVDYEGYELVDIDQMYEGSTLARLLWSRHCLPGVARSFLDVLSADGDLCDIVVFGHDIVAEGHRPLGDEQLQLSTSFGVADEDKYFLELDLGGRYRSVAEFEVGREIKLLYPDGGKQRLGHV